MFDFECIKFGRLRLRKSEPRNGALEGRQGRKPLLNHKIYLSPERSERAAEADAYNSDDFQLVTLACE